VPGAMEPLKDSRNYSSMSDDHILQYFVDETGISPWTSA